MLKSFQPKSAFDEGVVTYVDPLHYVCTVRTLGGRTYTGVKWTVPIGGNDATPVIGTTVVLLLSLSSPLILGSKPIVSSSDVPSAILGNTGGTVLPAPSSTTMFGVSNNSQATQGLVSGDHVVRSGTSLFGLLKTGTFIAKAHALSQIILSKLDQSVRVVGRSVEIFTDWGDEVFTNYYGRVYRFLGFNTSVLQNQNQTYQFYQVEGDVAAGEYAQAAPFTADPTKVPAAITTVRKKVLNNNAGYDIMVEELDETGSLKLTITQPATTQASQVYQTNSSIISTVSPSTPSSGTVVTQEDGLWEANVQNVSTIILNPTMAQMTSNGHAITITSSGVALT